MAGAAIPNPTDTDNGLPPLPKGYTMDKSADLPPLPKGYSFDSQKKNPVGNAAPTISQQSLNGGIGVPASPQSSDLIAVTDPALKQQIQHTRQQQGDRATLDDMHNKVTMADAYNKLPPNIQQQVDQINQYKDIDRDKLHAATPDEIAGQHAMDSTVGKITKSLAYGANQFDKGFYDLAVGGSSWVLNHLNTSLTDTQIIPDSFLNNINSQVDKTTGITPGQKIQIEEGKGLGMGAARTLGMLAYIAPAAVGGSVTELPKTMFALQGIGQGVETMNSVDPDHKLNPAVRDLYIAGNGLVNGIIMGDLKENVLSRPVQDKIVSAIAADALKEAAEKGLTEDAYKEALQKTTKTFTDKVGDVLTNAGIKGSKAGVDLSALQAANYVLKKGVDVASDHPVFNANLGELMQGISDVATKQAPIFGGIGAMLGGAKADPVEKQKLDIADQIQTLQESPTDGIIAEKEKAVRLKGLNQQLDEIVANQYDQQQDKASGKKITYSKGTGDEDGKFFKTIDGKKEEIEESRYKLEKPDEQPTQAKPAVEESVPATPQESVPEKADEELTNNQITNPQNDEKANEERGQENAIEKGNGEKTVPTKEKVSDGAENAPLQKPTESQILDDLKNKRFATFKYDKESDIPDVFKDKQPTINELTDKSGKVTKQFVITIPQSEADYLLQQKGEADNATQTEKIEQSGVAEHQGTTEQQQGVEENRDDQEEPVAKSEAKTGSSDSTPQGGKVADKAKVLADKIRSLKSDKNNAYGGLHGVATAIYDGGLETAATVIEQGGKLVDAIQAAVDHIKKNSDEKDDKKISAAITKDLADAGISDKEEDEPTGIRNADVAAERGKSVPREVITKPQIEAEGKRLVDSKELDPDELAKEVIRDKKPISAQEQAALLYHKTKLKNRQRAILKDETPEKVTENQIEYAKNADLIDQNQQATEIAGNVTGRALGFRTDTMNEDFSMNSVLRRAKLANNGEELSSKDKAELEKRSKRIEELEGKLSDREEAIRKAHENSLVDRVHRSAGLEEREGKREVTKATLRKEREGLLTELHLIAKKARSTAGANKIPVEMIGPLTKLARNYVLDGVNTLSGVVDRVYNDLKDHLDDLQKSDVADIIKDNFDKYLAEQNLIRLERSKKLQKAKLEALREQNKTGNFEKNTYAKIQVDADYLRIRADINREQTLINKKIDDIQNSNKSWNRKAWDFAVKYGRQAKLASATVLGKLVATGLTTMGIKGVTEGVGAGYSAILPRIAKKSTVEGGFNVKSLARSYAKAATAGMKDAYDELNIKAGGQSDLSALYGKYLATKLPAEAADFFGHLHSAIKAPIKRFAWEYSYAKRVAKGIQQGIDVQDPVIDATNRLNAYKDAERAIFMGDNVISSLYEANMKTLENKSSSTARTVAALSRILLPFVKVPTNIALSTGRYSFGLIPGAAKLAQIGTSSTLRAIGAESLAKVVHSGMGELTPEESDMVLRNLKHGTVGGAALLIGFFNPKNVGGFYQPGEKRKPSDVNAGALKIYGHKIPAFLTEHPIFQSMQIGATFRRFLDAHRHQEGNISAATLATASGLAKGVPLANEANNLLDILNSKNDHKLNTFIAKTVKGEIEPGVINQLAQAMDTKNGSPITLNPENMVQRAADKKHGLIKETKQELESGLPGLRKNVPRKH